MLDFIIIEDDLNYQKPIREAINKVCLKKDFEYNIKKYKTMNKMLLKVIEDVKPKIYIIDIELENNVSGFDIARRIRRDDWKSIIIILTSHSDLMYEVFKSQIMVLDFISKFDNYKSSLILTLNKAVNIVDNNKILRFKENNINYKIYIDDIVYITREIKTRKSIINTTYGKTIINKTLDKIMEELPSDFYRVHRSCIVNTCKVKKLDCTNEKITFINNKTTNLVSRYKKKGLLEYENIN